MADYLLGVDGGGTKTLALLAELDGRVISQGVGGASNYQAVGREAAQSALMVSIEAAFQSANLPRQPVRSMVLGMAGLGRSEDCEWLSAFCEANHLAADFEITTDAELMLWAGTPQGWGVGCIAGTGSIAFGRDEQGSTARAGGWGYLMGDEGSGYAIGLAILRAVTQAADGRAQPTTLTQAVLSEFRLEKPADLVGRIYRSGLGRGEIAQLAHLVRQEARRGDHAARRIEREAARALAEAIMAVVKPLGLSGTIPCALGGGVIVNNQAIARQVVRLIHKAGFSIQPVVVEKPAVGAVKLAVRRVVQRV